MKRNPDGYIRPLLENIRQIRIWMAFKTLLVAAPMLLIALCLALIWISEEPPEAWRTTTARFRRIEHGSSGGRGSSPNVLLTTDGRGFAIGDHAADAVEEKLTQGALCEVTYRFRLGIESLCGLTSGGEVIVDRAEYEAGWASDQQDYPRMIIILIAAAAVAAGLSNSLWCRKNRREIAQIEQRIALREAKNEARARKRMQSGRAAAEQP